MFPYFSCMYGYIDIFCGSSWASSTSTFGTERSRPSPTSWRRSKRKGALRRWDWLWLHLMQLFSRFTNYSFHMRPVRINLFFNAAPLRERLSKIIPSRLFLIASFFFESLVLLNSFYINMQLGVILILLQNTLTYEFPISSYFVNSSIIITCARIHLYIFQRNSAS